jgi:hypothetical protein
MATMGGAIASKTKKINNEPNVKINILDEG